jgi:L-aspartate oxidase
MTTRMLDQGVDHLWLDATGLDGFDVRFPTIAASVRDIGLDPSSDWLPIAPAAHYLSGGVVTDLDGATTLPGLWACGEVACTGVHGANRLASNSLLEGMVFAPRTVEAIDAGGDGPHRTGAMRSVLEGDRAPIGGRHLPWAGTTGAPAGGDGPEGADGRDAAALRDGLQRAMTLDAGVVRSATSLAGAAEALAAVAAAADAAVRADPGDAALREVANLVTCGVALVASASARTESRGNHWRRDHPATDDAQRHRLVVGGVPG